jgi:hypothetical protein
VWSARQWSRCQLVLELVPDLVWKEWEAVLLLLQNCEPQKPLSLRIRKTEEYFLWLVYDEYFFGSLSGCGKYWFLCVCELNFF